MRLIDADALSLQIRKLTQPREYYALDWMYTQAIAEAPTVDAVPIAECKKCAEKTNDCIVKLQEQIEQLVRERDAAVAKTNCIKCLDEISRYRWECRGVQDE